MSDPLHIEISAIAATQVRAAETWWGLNRPKAPVPQPRLIGFCDRERAATTVGVGLARHQDDAPIDLASESADRISMPVSLPEARRAD